MFNHDLPLFASNLRLLSATPGLNNVPFGSSTMTSFNLSPTVCDSIGGCPSGVVIELNLQMTDGVFPGVCTSSDCTSAPQCPAPVSTEVCNPVAQVNFNDPQAFLTSNDPGVTIGTSAAEQAYSGIVFPTPVFPYGSILMMVTTLGALGAFWFFKSRRTFNIIKN